jgi:hypothetical protein
MNERERMMLMNRMIEAERLFAKLHVTVPSESPKTYVLPAKFVSMHYEPYELSKIPQQKSSPN